MKSFLFALVLICTSFAYGADPEKEAIDFLANKTRNDFQKGIDLYNANKAPSAPAVKKVKSRVYQFVVKNNTVHFSIVNYLNDQVYINQRLVTKSTFGQPKTSWIDSLINTASAEEGNLDGESTRIILTALGALTKNLDEVGMVCFSGCQKETREQNLKKILATLDAQHEDCNQQLYTQQDTINKFPTYKMVSLLHSTFDPEFQSLKNFFQKISEANKKKTTAFMKDKLAIEKSHQSCVEVMTAGTIADGSASSGARGEIILRAGGITSDRIQAEAEKARAICVKMDELKSCLLTLQKNVSAINSIKRNTKEYGPGTVEQLPMNNSLSR